MSARQDVPGEVDCESESGQGVICLTEAEFICLINNLMAVRTATPLTK